MADLCGATKTCQAPSHKYHARELGHSVFSLGRWADRRGQLPIFQKQPAAALIQRTGRPREQSTPPHLLELDCPSILSPQPHLDRFDNSTPLRGGVA